MEDEKIIGLYFERNEQAIRETSDKYGGLCMQISENILKFLVENYGIAPISTPEADMAKFIG